MCVVQKKIVSELWISMKSCKAMLFFLNSSRLCSKIMWANLRSGFSNRKNMLKTQYDCFFVSYDHFGKLNNFNDKKSLFWVVWHFFDIFYCRFVTGYIYEFLFIYFSHCERIIKNFKISYHILHDNAGFWLLICYPEQRINSRYSKIKLVLTQ